MLVSRGLYTERVLSISLVMKIAIGLLWLLLGGTQVACAQWRLLYRSEDLAIQPDSVSDISSIESRGTMSKYLIVRHYNRKRELVPKSAVWGYVDNENGVWRSYDRELYRIIYYNGGWVEYSINRMVSARSFALYKAVMYSRNLDSKIKASWLQAMADAPPGHIVR